MDKELQALWDQVVKASQKAKAAGDSLSADDIDSFLKEKSKGKFGIADVTDVSVRNLGRSFTQGMTMNFADEALGALAGDQAQEDMRLRNALFKEAHPYISGASEMAGGVLPFIAAPEIKALQGIKALSNPMVRGAATGLATGSVAGAGAGEDAASRATGAAVGGTLGGVLGAAIPGAVAGYKYLTSETRPVERILRATVAKSGGEQALKGETARFAAAGKGADVMLADLSPELRGLTERSATINPRAAQLVEDAAQGRQAQQTQRMLNDLEATTPGLPKDAKTFGKDLHEASMRWANGAYDDLRATYQEVPNTVLKRPDVPPEAQNIKAQLELYRQQLKQVKQSTSPFQSKLAQDLPGRIEKLQARYEELVPPLTRAEEDFLQTLEQPFARGALRRAQIQTQIGDALEKSDQASFEKLFTVKEIVEDAANRMWQKEGQQGLAKRLTTLKNLLNGHLVDNIPEYSAVTEEYARRMNLERALQKGVDAWGDGDSAGLKTLIAKMSPEELHQFRAGMASELNAKLRNTATNQDAARRIMNSSIARDEKLQVIFGDQRHFNTFMEKARLEAKMARLRTTYTGSQTASRQIQAMADPTDVALSMTSHTMAVPGWNYLKAALTRSMASHYRTALSQQHAEALAPLLTTKGTEAIDALLSRLMNPAPAVGPQAAQGMGAAGGWMGQKLGQP